MEKLIETINKHLEGVKIDESAKELEQYFKPEEYPKGTLLLKEGQFSKKLYFIEKGIARTFSYDKGKEVTSWFYAEDQFLTAWHSFFSQSYSSFENIELLEDTKLYSITYNDYQKLLKSNLNFSIFGRKVVEYFLTVLDLYSKSYQFLSAKEKYKLVNETFPGICNRVKLGLVASVMGISQETLSRIRAGK